MQVAWGKAIEAGFERAAGRLLNARVGAEVVSELAAWGGSVAEKAPLF